MGSLAPFLPQHLVDSLAEHGAPDRLPHVDRFPAALLFSDISGFTALTEKLQARGREGAEEITDVIRAVFRPAIEAIDRWGGGIVSFGGDAVFVIFTGEAAVSGAQAAAEEVRRHFERHGEIRTSAGTVRLGISQALHYGTVHGMHLGRDGRRQYVVCGPTVSALARLEARASAGEILLSPVARAQQRTESARKPTGKAPVAPGEQLHRYVAPHVLQVMGHFEGEYRRAVMVFLETKGHSIGRLQGFVLSLLDVLERYEGILVSPDLSTAGTKWLCCFGAPVAHEDDVERAGRAALELLQGVPKGLAVRGGMHAGVLANVWMGAEQRRSYELMGDVTNTAARAAAKAAWGEVVVTEGVRRQLSGMETAGRGRHAAKGKAEPLELHALVATRAVTKQIRVSVPMVGRDAELAQIREALERAKDGQGCVIAVEGLPGLGKSRLKYEAAKVAASMGVAVHEGRTISFGGRPYWAIGEMLRHVLGIDEGADKDAILAAVKEEAGRLGMKAIDRHHLADVLGARYPDSPIQHLSPKDIRLNNTLAIRAYLLAVARTDGPHVLVLEDMHWSDEMTREAVEWVAKEIAGAGVVVLLLHRPGYEPPGQAQRMVLHELAQDDVGEMLAALLGDVPEKVGALVGDEAAGNPFYVEEVVRHLLESGILGLSDAGYELVRELGPEDLPDSVESVIGARLDRLAGDVKRVAQVGAVIGRSFLFEILSHLERDAAKDGVADLAQRELVSERAREPHLEYVFKHALTRDVAYAGILAARRRKLHAAVAQAIEKVLCGDRDSFLAMLGHHWELAEEKEKARACFLAGARRAAAAFAHEEAERLYRSYLALVDAPTAESIAARNELGLKVLQLRGRMVEAELEHRTALEEARARGDRGAVAASLREIGAVLWNTGRMVEAEGEHRAALEEARAHGDRGAVAASLREMGAVLWYTGRMDEAHALYGEALAIHREAGDRRSEGRVLVNLGALHMEQGQMDEARTLFEQALAIHRDVGNRLLEGAVLGNLGILHKEQGRPEHGRALYEQALAIHREVGDRRGEGYVLANLGLLHMEQGRTDEARVLYQQALAMHREAGNKRSEGVVLGNLAMLHEQQGRMEEARGTYEEALAIIRDVGDRRFEGIGLGNLAEWHLLGCDDPAGAEELAVRGEALLLEVADRFKVGGLSCTRGHIALARGHHATEHLTRARQLASQMKAEPDSELAKAIAKLERAQAAFHTGRPLVCGHCPDDLTSGRLRWLREHRPHAIPPSVLARLNDDGTLRPE